MVENLPFDDNSMPQKCNLKLTIPEDTQQQFRENIQNFTAKCKKEIDSYIEICGNSSLNS